jgi:hypothetical protein
MNQTTNLPDNREKLDKTIQDYRKYLVEVKKLSDSGKASSDELYIEIYDLFEVHKKKVNEALFTYLLWGDFYKPDEREGEYQFLEELAKVVEAHDSFVKNAIEKLSHAPADGVDDKSSKEVRDKVSELLENARATTSGRYGELIAHLSSKFDLEHFCRHLSELPDSHQKLGITKQTKQESPFFKVSITDEGHSNSLDSINADALEYILAVFEVYSSNQLSVDFKLILTKHLQYSSLLRETVGLVNDLNACAAKEHNSHAYIEELGPVLQDLLQDENRSEYSFLPIAHLLQFQRLEVVSLSGKGVASAYHKLIHDIKQSYDQLKKEKISRQFEKGKKQALCNLYETLLQKNLVEHASESPLQKNARCLYEKFVLPSRIIYAVHSLAHQETERNLTPAVISWSQEDDTTKKKLNEYVTHINQDRGIAEDTSVSDLYIYCLLLKYAFPHTMQNLVRFRRYHAQFTKECEKHNRLFAQGLLLAYLVEYYCKTNDENVAEKILEYETLYSDDLREKDVYYQYYKLGLFYLRRFKNSTVVADTSRLDHYTKTSRYLNRADSLFQKRGVYNNSFTIHYSLTTLCKGYFMYSAFMPYYPHDLAHKIEQARSDAQADGTIYIHDLVSRTNDRNQEFVNSLRSVKDSIDEKLDRSQASTIEILAIFASIVMFVASEIQIIRSVTSIKAGVILTIALGLAFTFFAFLIHLVAKPIRNPDIKTRRETWRTFIFLTILVVLTLLFVYFGEEEHHFQKLIRESESTTNTLTVDNNLLQSSTENDDTNEEVQENKPQQYPPPQNIRLYEK